MSGSDEETLQFVAANFPSVWALEILLALKRAGGACTPQELIASLRASDLVVSKALEALAIAGLVSIELDTAIYLPANRAVAAMVEKTDDLYRRRPNAVCRVIVRAGTSSESRFANAFKVGRNSDD